MGAAAVQTALRTITGWEAVTVASTVAVGTRSLTASHAFTVTFPAGYDDGGQIQEVGVYPTGTYTLGGTATAHAIEIVDQRFSNTLWLGRITGWHAFTTSSTGTVLTAASSLGAFEIGDHIKVTQVDYGHGTGTMVANAVANSGNCKLHLVKDTLVLDSVPDAWTGVVDITYTAPSGSCSVSEVAKGTSESATCSNRGACDGGSGLCTCHEGYSGEACETQTVLV